MINDPFWGKIKCIDAEKLQELLEEIKPMDIVPVVRCKDCKHNSLKRMSGNTYCDLGMGLFQLYDFCSMGERRKE